MTATSRLELAASPRLQCDEMLASLARWLRAAGHDTALAPSGTADAEVLAQCRRDRRLLLTRDRALAQAAAGIVPTHLLASNGPDAQARELAGAGLDWRLAPFTRCIADNEPVTAAASDKVAGPTTVPDAAWRPPLLPGMPAALLARRACASDVGAP